jgi:hypothetical protein
MDVRPPNPDSDRPSPVPAFGREAGVHEEATMSDHEIDDSFATYPPNALLSLFEDERVNDVVAVLSDPVIQLRRSELCGRGDRRRPCPIYGSVSSFIDMIGRRGLLR